MANDSIDIVEQMDFHPCNTPRGMLYYDLDTITHEQQAELNKLKREKIREDEMYLAAHPEVRAIIALATRYILRKQPRTNLHEEIAQFFSRPHADIKEEVNQYIKEREPHVYEGNSAVIITPEDSVTTVASEHSSLKSEAGEEKSLTLEDVSEEKDFPLDIINEIIDSSLKRLNVDVDENEEDTDEVAGFVLADILDQAMVEKEVNDTSCFKEEEHAALAQSIVTELWDTAIVQTKDEEDALESTAREVDSSVLRSIVTENDVEANLLSNETQQEIYQDSAVLVDDLADVHSFHQLEDENSAERTEHAGEVEVKQDGNIDHAEQK